MRNKGPNQSVVLDPVHTSFSAKVYSDKRLEHTGLAPRTYRSSPLWTCLSLCWAGREGHAMLCFQSVQMKADESAQVSHCFSSKSSIGLGLQEMQLLERIQDATSMVIIWEQKLGLWGKREEILLSKTLGQFKTCNFILL